ncbi:MAG: twin-arginine translocase subunit TatC [Raoultibacter sp.]|jgi:sec-independent protein translocase protein TatC
MPVGAARMPLFDHLGELRMRLVRIVACLVISIFVFYLASLTVAEILMMPVAEYLPKDEGGQVQLMYFGGLDAFTYRFMVSFWVSLVVCMPVILWQLLAFFLPALKPSERKWFVPTFAAGVGLFIFGTVFCYFIILPAAFEWLTEQAGDLLVLMPEAKQWLSLIIKFEIGFGLAFELPLVIFYLVIFDIVPYAKLRKNWRTVYIVLMVISAMVTPDASPITMLLMCAAMIGLYEVSLFIARIALRRRIKRQDEELAKEEAEQAAWEEERARKKAAE